MLGDDQCRTRFVLAYIGPNGDLPPRTTLCRIEHKAYGLPRFLALLGFFGQLCASQFRYHRDPLIVSQMTPVDIARDNLSGFVFSSEYLNRDLAIIQVQVVRSHQAVAPVQDSVALFIYED